MSKKKRADNNIKGKQVIDEVRQISSLQNVGDSSSSSSVVEDTNECQSSKSISGTKRESEVDCEMQSTKARKTCSPCEASNSVPCSLATAMESEDVVEQDIDMTSPTVDNSQEDDSSRGSSFPYKSENKATRGMGTGRSFNARNRATQHIFARHRHPKHFLKLSTTDLMRLNRVEELFYYNPRTMSFLKVHTSKLQNSILNETLHTKPLWEAAVSHPLPMDVTKQHEEDTQMASHMTEGKLPKPPIHYQDMSQVPAVCQETQELPSGITKILPLRSQGKWKRKRQNKSHRPHLAFLRLTSQGIPTRRKRGKISARSAKLYCRSADKIVSISLTPTMTSTSKKRMMYRTSSTETMESFCVVRSKTKKLCVADGVRDRSFSNHNSVCSGIKDYVCIANKCDDSYVVASSLNSSMSRM